MKHLIVLAIIVAARATSATDRCGSPSGEFQSLDGSWRVSVASTGRLEVFYQNGILVARHDVGAVADVTFSLQSDQIVFPANPNGDGFDLYKLDLPPVGEPEQLTNWAGSEDRPKFSPNGQYVAFVSGRTGVASLFILDLTDRHALQLSNSRLHADARLRDAAHGEFVPPPPDGDSIAWKTDGSVEWTADGNVHDAAIDEGMWLPAREPEAQVGLVRGGATDLVLLRFPMSSEAAETAYPTAYFSHGGQDWNCKFKTYGAHKGSDFGIGGFPAMDAGRDVVAAAAGTVVDIHDGEADRCTTSDCAPPFGNFVKMRYADGREGLYAHLKKFSVVVKQEQSVECGEKIGQVGSSGNSSGPHLHYEARESGVGVDPFDGMCSFPPTFWIDQGNYLGLPGTECNQQPVAYLDVADCESLRGWGRDIDSPNDPVRIDVYVDGPAGTGMFLTNQFASLFRADVGNHAFNIAVPALLKDGREHAFYVYAINIPEGQNPQINGSPMSITCSAPVPSPSPPTATPISTTTPFPGASRTITPPPSVTASPSRTPPVTHAPSATASPTAPSTGTQTVTPPTSGTATPPPSSTASPNRPSCTPLRGVFLAPTGSDRSRALDLLAGLTDRVRTLGQSTSPYRELPCELKAAGFQVLSGPYLERGNASLNTAEITGLVENAACIDIVVLPSVMSLRGWSPAEIETVVADIKVRLSNAGFATLPVTPAESASFYLSNPNIVSTIRGDTLAVGGIGYFAPDSPDPATVYRRAGAERDELERTFPGKAALFAELGWPSGGAPRASDELQRDFLNLVIENTAEIDYIYFELADEPVLGAPLDAAGLFEADLDPKLVISALCAGPSTPGTPTETATPTFTRMSTPIGNGCTGDCSDDGTVSISELIRGVNIALNNLPLSDCTVFDSNGNDQITIDELISAVRNALTTCPEPDEGKVRKSS